MLHARIHDLNEKLLMTEYNFNEFKKMVDNEKSTKRLSMVNSSAQVQPEKYSKGI